MSQALTIGAEAEPLDQHADAEIPPDLDLLSLIDWTPRAVLLVAGPGDALGPALMHRFPGSWVRSMPWDADPCAALADAGCWRSPGDDRPASATDLPMPAVDTVLISGLPTGVDPLAWLCQLRSCLPVGARVLAHWPNTQGIGLLDALAAGCAAPAGPGSGAEPLQPHWLSAGFALKRCVALPLLAAQRPPGLALGADHVETDKLVVKALGGDRAAALLAGAYLLLAEVPDAEPDPAAAPAAAAERPPWPAGPWTLSPLQRLRDNYLDMVRRSLVGLIHEDAALAPQGRLQPFRAQVREQGLDWPATAHSMIGHKRMLSLQRMTEQVIGDGIPGDLIETGVWRGGACIMMRAVLQAYEVGDRRVWVADSFAGLPPPLPDQYPQDAGDTHHLQPDLAVPMVEVQRNFAQYGLLDDQVRFLPGWFCDTLPGAPTGPLALMRLDGDMYQSTMDALQALFPRLSPGGFVVIDDYGYIASCRAAVDDYRGRLGITDPLVEIDQFGVYWRNQQPHALRDQPWPGAPPDVLACGGLGTRLQAPARRTGFEPPPPLQVTGVVFHRAACAPALAGHHLESPLEGVSVQDASLALKGWAVGRQQPVVSVSVSCDGRVIAQSPLNLPRPDVARLHPAAESSGFALHVPRSRLAPGRSCELAATLADGSRVVMASFTLALPAQGVG